MGSTFAVELPIYTKSMDPQTTLDMTSPATSPQRLKPRSHSISHHVAVNRVVPFETVTDMVCEHHGDSDIEGISDTLSILIVDDSSANRSGSPYDFYLHRLIKPLPPRKIIVSLIKSDRAIYRCE